MRKRLTTIVLCLVLGATAEAQTTLPDDIPDAFVPPDSFFDYERVEAMIPMRDGVELFTVIWIPKGRDEPMPVVLTRTPYDAAGRASWTGRPNSPRAAAAIPMPDVPLIENGYIRAYQDVRGKYRSGGDYTMVMPPRGPLNDGPVDQTTDAWDTIDWLVKNVPNNNGKVGLIGVSYEGWACLMALLEPHPALAAAIPMNAMVDGWMGDDWYHNGALRQFSLEYVYRQTTAKVSAAFPMGSRDAYSAYLEAGSASAMAAARGMDRLSAWKRVIDNPAYNEYWQEQAVDRLLAEVPHTVPTLTVHGLFDQEDIYGAIASYQAMEARDAENDRNFLLIGPWFHGQQDPWFHQRSGSHIGPLQLGSDTTDYFLYEVMLPFFERTLKGRSTAKGMPPVVAFETGGNEWRAHDAWPPGETSDKRLYLRQDGRVVTALPEEDGFASYISDPAKPVPYRVLPIVPNDAPDTTWAIWMVDDQRQFTTRPDVLTYVSEPLEEPVTVAGEVTAHLRASTSGSDADWVVKLIDLYPDEYPMQPELGGYALMVSGEIFRGRYRKSFERPEPIARNEVLDYRIRLPNAHHRFRRGHRIMVQVQSSWFPLYDRNPQSFVDNIAYAPERAYQPAEQRIHHGSFIGIDVRQ